MYLIFDTETTGLPRNFKAPITDTDNWPRVVQLAWQLHDESGKLIKHMPLSLNRMGLLFRLILKKCMEFLRP